MIDETLTMIPGPTPVHPRILAALARPTVSHLAPSFTAAFRQALVDFRDVCQSTPGQPFIVAGGGTLAMEMALVNVVAPGERLLVVSQGYFGHRFAELAEAFGVECDLLASEWSEAVAPEEVQERLERQRYAAVTITHADTSTGTAAPVEAYCELLRDREELAILDGVCATGGLDERFDAWGLDVLLTAPQKALGAPPGAALVLFSQRALAARSRLQRVPAFYADVQRWLPVMQDPSRYYSTPCVNQIMGLAEALSLVKQEGLAARFARHAGIARAVRAGLAAMGLELFTGADCRADTLSVVRYPEGIDDAAFRSEMARCGVVVAGGLGPLAGKGFRVGHMGNIGVAEVVVLLQSIEGSLAQLGHPVARGSALAAAAPHLAAIVGVPD